MYSVVLSLPVTDFTDVFFNTENYVEKVNLPLVLSDQSPPVSVVSAQRCCFVRGLGDVLAVIRTRDLPRLSAAPLGWFHVL